MKRNAEPAAPVMSPGKAAYETRRASEAGMSLDSWLKKKARETAAAPSEPVRKAPARKGLISRLLDRAHKPL